METANKKKPRKVAWAVSRLDTLATTIPTVRFERQSTGKKPFKLWNAMKRKKIPCRASILSPSAAQTKDEECKEPGCLPDLQKARSRLQRNEKFNEIGSIL